MKNIKVNGFDANMNVRMVVRGGARWIYAEPTEDDEYGIVWNIADMDNGKRVDYFTRTALEALKLIKSLLKQD